MKLRQARKIRKFIEYGQGIENDSYVWSARTQDRVVSKLFYRLLREVRGERRHTNNRAVIGRHKKLCLYPSLVRMTGPTVRKIMRHRRGNY